MSRLVLVRHAQASAGAEDYDRLSELGWRQAEALGRHWARTGLRPDRVWTGPCVRHRETAAGVHRSCRRHGRSWPVAEALDGLDEHAGFAVFARSLPGLAAADREARAALAQLDGEAVEDRRVFYRVYRRVTLAWVRGELEEAELGVEGWHAFRRRAERAIASLTAAGADGRTVLAFTSAGPVAAAVGRALGLDDEKTLELSWIVRNSALSEFLFSDGRFSLRSFNALPHLTEPGLETWV